MPKLMDLIGQRFGRIEVIRRASNKDKRVRWWGRCDCGTEKIFWATNLQNHATASCGCLRRAMMEERSTSHGLSHKPEHSVWLGMRKRCQSPSYYQFEIYGGRGIRICERWQDFANFYSDMGPRPSASHSIDRIDPDGDYEPSNCRWATPTVQNNNRRNCYRIHHDGEVLTLSQLGRAVGIPKHTLASRAARLRLTTKEFDSSILLCYPPRRCGARTFA